MICYDRQPFLLFTRAYCMIAGIDYQADFGRLLPPLFCFKSVDYQHIKFVQESCISLPGMYMYVVTSDVSETRNSFMYSSPRGTSCDTVRSQSYENG